MLVCLLLGATFVVEENLRGRWTLAAWEKRMRAQGEKLDVNELLPPTPAADENGAPAFLAAARQLKSADQFPSLMTITTPGRAVVLQQRTHWIAYGPNYKSRVTNTWDDLQSQLDPAAETLQALEAALQRSGFHTGDHYHAGFFDFQLAHPYVIKKTSLWLQAAGLRDLHARDFNGALKHARALSRLTEALRDEPLAISQLVRIAVGQIALNFFWEAAQTPGLTDEQLLALQRTWPKQTFAADMVRSFEMERDMTRVHWALLRAPRPRGYDWLALREETGAKQIALLKHLYQPFWRIAWADQDELHALERWQAVIEPGRVATQTGWAKSRSVPTTGANDESSMLSFGEDKPPLGWYDRCRFLFSKETFASMGPGMLKALELETRQNLTWTAIALRRYQQRHGRYPAELAALVPDFLDELPVDRIDGQPLRYQPKSDGTFLLYSIGRDAKDDGGDPTPEPGYTGDPPSFSRGRDLVWPLPATDAEADAAEAVKPRK